MSKTVSPPTPYNCRRPAPRARGVADEESFDDELSKRLTLHVLLDDAFGTTNPPSEPAPHIPPSWRLYRSLDVRPGSAAAWDVEVRAWRHRFEVASDLDEKWAKSSLAQLLLALELPLLCRDPSDSLARRIIRGLSSLIGRAVHEMISYRYLERYGTDTIACDGRVYFPDNGRTETLSVLATQDRDTVYGALNYCLAGQRNDIINIDRREMWEIKPVNLTRRNLMQLWGYVDNYEVARVMCHYSGRSVPAAIRPGDPNTLDQGLLAPFELYITPQVILTITPMAQPSLPGIIGYRAERSERRSDEQDAIRAVLALGALRSALEAARKRETEEELLEAEEAARRLAILCAVGVVLAAVAAGAAVAFTGGLILGAAGIGTGAVTLGAGEAAIAGAEIISLTAVRGAAALAVEQMAIQTVRAATTELAAGTLAKAAGLATIYVAGQAFSVPEDVAPMCIEAGCAAGAAAVPAPLR